MQDRRWEVSQATWLRHLGRIQRLTVQGHSTGKEDGLQEPNTTELGKLYKSLEIAQNSLTPMKITLQK